MRNPVTRLHMLIRRFISGESAVAAVEFALILPVMLTLYIGSVELSSAISVDKRVATVSGALGDLVARADSSITASTVSDYFMAASATMAPYASSDVKQIVSSVRVKADGSTSVLWSMADNGASEHATGSAYNVPENLKSLVTENGTMTGYVIVAEAQLNYTPMIGYVFDSDFSLYHQYFFLPRFGEEITCSDC